MVAGLRRGVPTADDVREGFQIVGAGIAILTPFVAAVWRRLRRARLRFKFAGVHRDGRGAPEAHFHFLRSGGRQETEFDVTVALYGPERRGLAPNLVEHSQNPGVIRATWAPFAVFSREEQGDAVTFSSDGQLSLDFRGRERYDFVLPLGMLVLGTMDESRFAEFRPWKGYVRFELANKTRSWWSVRYAWVKAEEDEPDDFDEETGEMRFGANGSAAGPVRWYHFAHRLRIRKLAT